MTEERKLEEGSPSSATGHVLKSETKRSASPREEAKMEAKRGFSRRDFLRLSGVAATGAIVAACTPEVIKETVEVEKEVVVEQTVEVEVEKEVEVTSTPKPVTGPVTIRYAHVADPGELEVRQAGIAEFEELHPDIDVVAELVPEDGMAEKITTMVAGGAAPDVVYVHPSFVPLYASGGILATLDDMAAGDPEYEPDDFFEKVVGHFVTQGKTYAYPYYSGPLVTYFNKTLFDEAGEDYPTAYMDGFQDGSDEWTWEKALEVGQRMTTGEGASKTFGIWPVWMSLHAFDHVIWSFGGELWDAEMTKCLLSEPAALEAIQYQADLYLKYNVAPLPEQEEGMPGGFNSGRVAMNTGGIRAHVPGLMEVDFELGMAPVPKGKAGRFTRDGPNGAGIIASSQLKEAAWEFVKYQTGPKPGDTGGMKYEFAMHRALPVRKSLYDSAGFMDGLLPWEDIDVYRVASDSVGNLPLPSRYAEINRTWKEYWEAILVGQMTVEEAVEAVCAEIDVFLTEG
jgi:multiple sugar transport system substrate-binding protein